MKAKRNRGGENEVFDESDESLYEDDDFDDEEEEERGSNRKRRRSGSRNDAASRFLDIEAEVDSDEEDEDDEAEDDGFIVDSGADLNPDDDDVGEGGRAPRRPFFPEEDEEEENLEDFERRIRERFSNSHHVSCDDVDEIERQALLPCVRDPKLWMVKCAIGHERELSLCLMQKGIEHRGRLQIRSAVARDDLQGFIYVEAEKEAHVREACRGLRNVISKEIKLVPIKEMTEVVSVKGKGVDVSRDSWVRMKVGIYDGDLGKVVDVDDVKRRVTVKLVPRIDWQALGRKLEGVEAKKRGFRVPARLMNVDEAREVGIRVERRRNRVTGDYFDKVGNMLFRDGFLYKTVARRSISCHNVNPTLDELERFGEPAGRVNGGDGGGVFSMNRKKVGFVKGDRVVVVKGDLKKLGGRVEKVEEESVYIRPEMKGLPETLVIYRKEVCKLFEIGNHVKVVSGSQEGATGMVVKVDQDHGLVTIWSDKTNKHICVFSDDVAETSGSAVNGDDGNVGTNFSRLDHHRTPRSRFYAGGKGGQDANGLGAGTRVKIRQGPYKGYGGRVVEVKGSSVRVELESQMKIVSVDRQSCISDSGNMAAAATPYRYGNETPMHPCSTPLHPYMVSPMRDPRATPMHPCSTPIIH